MNKDWRRYVRITNRERERNWINGFGRTGLDWNGWIPLFACTEKRAGV